MYEYSIYPITPSLWRWEVRSGGALLRCGTAPTWDAADLAVDEFTKTWARPGPQGDG
jgi:hypothetical protein